MKVKVISNNILDNIIVYPNTLGYTIMSILRHYSVSPQKGVPQFLIRGSFHRLTFLKFCCRIFFSWSVSENLRKLTKNGIFWFRKFLKLTRKKINRRFSKKPWGSFVKKKLQAEFHQIFSSYCKGRGIMKFEKNLRELHTPFAG